MPPTINIASTVKIQGSNDVHCRWSFGGRNGRLQGFIKSRVRDANIRQTIALNFERATPLPTLGGCSLKLDFKSLHIIALVGTG